MSRPSNPSVTLRKLALLTHRYVGLLIAAFLVMAGVTGTVIAFDSELDAALNPEWFRVAPPESGRALLDPFTLIDEVQKQYPNVRLEDVPLERKPGASVNLWVDGKELFVDPYDGKILGIRTWGDISEGVHNLVTFIYRLHYSLALGEVGVLVFGAVALLWTFDCFVGAYLTLPQRSARAASRSLRGWFTSWLPMWLLKTGKLFSLVFTWHRASGLWVWLVLLVFAWSGVALNLGEQVYDPVMSTFLGREAEPPDRSALAQARTQPALSRNAALLVGRELMNGEAQSRDFEIFGERYLSHDPGHGVYIYAVESSLDISERLADTSLVFDSDTGSLLAFHATTGQHAGNTLRSWLIALHFGEVRAGGLAYRVFVALIGLVVALLSASGVWIWWVKRTKGSDGRPRPTR